MSTITLAQAQAIVDKHFKATIVKVSQLPSDRFSHTPGLETVLLDLAIGANVDATHSSFLVVASDASPSPYTNTLPVFPTIIDKIRSTTSIPISSPILDDTRTVIPHVYLVTPIYAVVSSNLVSLAQARAGKLLTPHQQALIDLQLGSFLGELHKGAQNDWFGRPTLGGAEPADPSYDWQETFVSLLEGLLDTLPAMLPLSNPDITTSLRTSLARAISAFLFSDVDVPSLVWLTGSPDDVFLAFTAAGEFATFAILPAVAHAVYGDPLLETFFLDGASAAFWEGYRTARGEQDGAIMVFPRQRTKRVWYDVFLALLVLKQRGDKRDDKSSWAEECIRKSVEVLKDAPCY
ncbi:hypothetical protein MKEN_00515000 [Mycena kentingensis (nom. inval.)]|nr:hypothetical protein MKEN_00515000 [Mycena kentingensis (nom. inval.)]